MHESIKRDEFINRVHRIISDNLKVSAKPDIRRDGTIGATARLEIVGDVDGDLDKLADWLLLAPRPVIDGDSLTADDDVDEGAPSDAVN